jgi:hypothetical protein
MGLEKRKRNEYFYKKKRLGDRVISQYVGSGITAFLAQREAIQNKQKRADEQKKLEEKRNEILKFESEIDRVFGWIEILSASELVASGYHNHKGEWRKRRNENSREKRKNRNGKSG